MFRYSGPAVIALEGREVLHFHSNGNGMLYFVGGLESGISIRDFRAASMEAGQLALKGSNSEGFRDVFSSLAWVEVKDNPEMIEITLREYHSEEGTPVTLWVGVLSKPMDLIRRSFWERIRDLDEGRIAFAALLDD